ncbi:MAG TPA: hypothetical protein VMA73_34165 [Streptosporangiaceae bacterium]|nr:hypothetical protein [Streptosporangiaceae bacterium]
MTPLTRPLVLPATLLLAGGILAVSLPASGSEASTTTTLCNSQTASVSSGAYMVDNNEWGSSAPECITTNGSAEFRMVNSAIANGGDGAPGGYPDIYKGCNYGVCTSGSGLPIRVSNIHEGTVTTSWQTAQPGGSSIYNAAYDIWFNQTSSTSGQANGTELMVWLRRQGPKHPYGSQVATDVSIGGRSYNVWYGNAHGFNTVTYLMTSGKRSVTNLDLRPLEANAVGRGYLKKSWYLISVEAGFEVWQGGTGLATKSFSVKVTRHVTCDATVSQRNPADHSGTDVLVRTADHAQVTTVAHFTTGNRSRRVRATAQGRARAVYGVRTARPGVRVPVSVAVRHGNAAGTCSTSFTPRAA